MKEYTGINIQWPISELILNKKKTIETRTYPIPTKYLNVPMAMIETPGPKGKFKARIVAIIKFTKCFPYEDENDFYLDSDRHLVTPNSPWAWKENKRKWGWELEVLKVFESKTECTSRGIVYRKSVFI